MAKNDPKVHPLDPAPPAPPIEPPTDPEVEESESEKGSLPPGVAMHPTGVLPYTTDRAARLAPDPKQPPPGWRGSFARCGGCGDFLTGDRCANCAPDRLASNVVNGGL